MFKFGVNLFRVTGCFFFYIANSFANSVINKFFIFYVRFPASLFDIIFFYFSKTGYLTTVVGADTYLFMIGGYYAILLCGFALVLYTPPMLLLFTLNDFKDVLDGLEDKPGPNVFFFFAKSIMASSICTAISFSILIYYLVFCIFVEVEAFLNY